MSHRRRWFDVSVVFNTGSDYMPTPSADYRYLSDARDLHRPIEDGIDEFEHFSVFFGTLIVVVVTLCSAAGRTEK